jgi:AAA domain, putative AbiEii toxin, Type IV TA system
MADGITRIAVEGFKSISKKQSIEIAPLTILAGANRSGKSSIMQPLLMLKQTLDAAYDPGPLKIDGPNVKFTSSEQFLSKRGMEPRHLQVMIDTQGLKFAVTLVTGSEAGLEVEEETYEVVGSRLTLYPGMSSSALQQALRGFDNLKDLAHHEFQVSRNRFFLNLKEEPWRSLTLEYPSPYIHTVIHVPGLRGSPSRTYPVASVGPNFPATFEHYVGSVIASWQSENSREADALNNDLASLGIARRIYARRLTEVEIDLRVNRLSDGGVEDMISVADVGFGVSQIIPVLVALRAAEDGQLAYLEEPEIHLHPRAQVKLAEILANAAERGVRVVAETHSTLLLTAIQTLVAKGELSPDLVKLHWFQRDPKTGVTEVTSTDLDENGAFVQSDWPEDFDDVILKAESAYLDAVEGRQVR